jgi:DNA polymerase-3 subunit delta
MKKSAAPDPLKAQAELDRDLKAGKFAPLYLFEGKEAYLREQAVKKLAAAAVDEAMRDFNYARIAVVEGDLSEALTLANQYPMISARRVVVVTGFEAVNDERQLESLKAYLQRPADTTVLVFVSEALDNRRTIATMLRKGCQVVSYEPLDEKTTAIEWVRTYAQTHGAAIDGGGAAYLIGTVGSELQRLTTELDKLIAYVLGNPGSKGRITPNEIDELVLHTREHSNFELTDALLNNQRERALRLLSHIFDNPPENPQTLAIMMVGAIAKSFRNHLIAKDMMAQGLSQEEIAKAVGQSPYAVRYLNERARKMDAARLIKAVRRIAETDIALKSSLATPRLQLEMLVCELCPTEAKRAVVFR